MGTYVFDICLYSTFTYLGNISFPGRESWGASLATFKLNFFPKTPTYKSEENGLKEYLTV